MRHCGRLLVVLALAFAIPTVVRAQDKGATPPPAEEQALKPGQLEALVAPIALYPDPLLANVLAASTYPLEVVQADRWLENGRRSRETSSKPRSINSLGMTA